MRSPATTALYSLPSDSVDTGYRWNYRMVSAQNAPATTELPQATRRD